MAPRRPPSSTPETPVLSVEQLHLRIRRLQDCIRALGEFDAQKVQKRYGIPEVMELEASIKGLSRQLSATALRLTVGIEMPLHSTTDLALCGPAMHSAGARKSTTTRGTLEEARQYLTEGKQRSIGLLQEAIRALEYEIADRQHHATPAAATAAPSPTPRPREVFVVHGHDEGAREAIARFLERIGFKAIILHEQANKGRTVIEKVVDHGDVGFAVVLLTPDDEGCKKGEIPRPRARQNVVLELATSSGHLGANTCSR